MFCWGYLVKSTRLNLICITLVPLQQGFILKSRIKIVKYVFNIVFICTLDFISNMSKSNFLHIVDPYSVQLNSNRYESLFFYLINVCPALHFSRVCFVCAFPYLQVNQRLRNLDFQVTPMRGEGLVRYCRWCAIAGFRCNYTSIFLRTSSRTGSFLLTELFQRLLQTKD